MAPASSPTPGTVRFLGNVSVPDPGGLVYDPYNAYVYVSSDTASGYVAALSGTTVVGTVSTSYPNYLAYDAYNHDIYVENGDDEVTVIGGSNDLTILATIDLSTHFLVGTGPVVDPQTGQVYVAGYTEHTSGAEFGATGAIDVLSASSLVETISENNCFSYVGYDGANGVMFVTTSAGTDLVDCTNSVQTLGVVVVLGLQFIEVVSNESGGGGPLVYNPSNGYMYADAAASVQLYGGSKGQALEATVSTGMSTNAEALGFDPANDYVYGDALGASTLFAISGESLLADVSVGSDTGTFAISAVSGTVYVPAYESSVISVVSGLGTTRGVSFASGEAPWTVVSDDETGALYAIGDSNLVGVLTGAPLVAAPTAGNAPKFGVYDSLNEYTYMPDTAGASVAVFYEQSELTTIPVGTDPHSAAYDPENGYVYVVNTGSNSVSVIVGTSVLATVPVGSSPAFAVYDPGNEEMYILNNGGSSVTVLGGNGGSTVLTTIPVGANPFEGVYVPGGQGSEGDLYVSDFGASEVSVIASSSNTVVATVGSGSGSTPAFLTYDPGNGFVYVANQASSTWVTVINTATNLATSVAGGSAPHDVAYDPNNGYVYVPDWGGGVTLLSGTTDLGTIQVGVGSEPLLAAFDPQNGYVYVSNSASNSVSVLNGAFVGATVWTGASPALPVYVSLSGYMLVPVSGAVDVIGYVPIQALWGGLEIDAAWAGPGPLTGDPNPCWSPSWGDTPGGSITTNLQASAEVVEFPGGGSEFITSPTTTAASSASYPVITGCSIATSQGPITAAIPGSCAAGAGPSDYFSSSATFTLNALPPLNVWSASIMIGVAVEICSNGEIYGAWGISETTNWNWQELVVDFLTHLAPELLEG